MQYNQTVTLKDGRTCIVRNGTEADAEAVLADFILTHGETDFLSSYPDEIKLTLEQEKEYLKQRAESAREAALVAEADGQIVGTAGIHRIGSAEKFMHRAGFGVSIEKAWWGLGIGRALTNACIACAKAAGYTQLELEVVAANTSALALYQSAGFVEYGRNPRGFRSRLAGMQEIISMRLELDE